MATNIAKTSTADDKSSCSDFLNDIINTARETAECLTLELIGCNPIGGDSFTEASITTQVKLSTFPCYEECRRKREKTVLLRFEDVFDIDMLKKLISVSEINKGDNEPGPERKKQKTIANAEFEAFRILNRYYSNFDYHQKCLKKVLASQSKPVESDVIKVLITHLFQPLSGGTCFIDNHILIEGNHLCSCGCGEKVEQGHTGIGLELTWHGYIDILVKRTIPVEVLKEVEERELELSVEENGEKEGIKVNKPVTSQLIAQTITNAFAQSNKNPAFLGIPIPAFGCTSSEIYIYAYDCKNDVLLKKLPVTKGRNLYQRSTAVMIWLYMNFSLFMRKDVTDLAIHPRLCDFKARFNADESVHSLYRRVKCEVAEFQQNTDEPDIDMITYIRSKKY